MSSAVRYDCGMPSREAGTLTCNDATCTVVALRSEIALHDVRRLVEVIRMLGNDVGANSKADCTRELFAIECVRRRRTYLENQEKGTQSFAQHGWRCLAAVVTVRSAADKPLGSYW